MLGVMTSPVRRRTSILLDCDPGHDDAIAIVVAARHADLVGITTVAGNAPLERTTLQRAGHARPARHRRAGPLAEPTVRSSPSPSHAAFVHGESGLDGADLPAPDHGPLDGTDAVGFIVDTCRATEGIWLVPVGPLTNIALALRSRARHRDADRRDLADGRRHVRQPDRGG